MKISESVMAELKSRLMQKKLPGAPTMAEFDELEKVKREKVKVKFEMDLTTEQAAVADRDADAALLRSASCLNSIEDLRKKVDDLNADHVLVEIARLDAVAETREIEERRSAEAAEFSEKIERIRDRTKKLKREIDRSEKEEEEEEMEKELEAAKRDLAEMKDEGFRLMRSMDRVRVELEQISRERERLQKAEESGELKIQRINSKLVKARSKLEAAMASAHNSRSILANLSAALQQLRSEAENMRKEKENAEVEIRSAKKKIQSTELNLESMDQRLEDAIQGLKIAKNSEMVALAKLKRLSERTTEIRACAASRSSAITMSAFELEYLKTKAEEAKKIAEMKTDAARAWIDAFKASEEEISLKIERAKKEMVEIEAGGMKIDAIPSNGRLPDEEEEDLEPVISRRKSVKENGLRSKSRARRSLTHGQRPFPQSPAVVLKRKKVMPGFVKFLRRGRKAAESQ